MIRFVNENFELGITSDMSSTEEKFRKKLMNTEGIAVIQSEEDGDLYKLLMTIANYSQSGHSFRVVVDPGEEDYEQKFYIDGDGNDKLWMKDWYKMNRKHH